MLNLGGLGIKRPVTAVPKTEPTQFEVHDDKKA